MKKNPQGKWWRRLDNTGKIFPLIANENLSNVFRITATLKEDVRPELLQRALEDVLPHFEGFQVKLKRGFFWYYFESNKRTPLIEQESGYPCRYIDPKSNQLFLFLVAYIADWSEVGIADKNTSIQFCVNASKSDLSSGFHRI